jgi:hypothetical protein
MPWTAIILLLDGFGPLQSVQKKPQPNNIVKIDYKHFLTELRSYKALKHENGHSSK